MRKKDAASRSKKWETRVKGKAKFNFLQHFPPLNTVAGPAVALRTEAADVCCQLATLALFG